jgi:hypothetical protein
MRRGQHLIEYELLLTLTDRNRWQRIVDLCSDVGCKLPPENFWNKDKTAAPKTTSTGAATKQKIE